MRFRYTPLAKDLPVEIKEKVRRRAIRHFEGRKVTHRVVESSDDTITFAFNRRGIKYPEMGMNFQITLKRIGG